MKSKNGKFIKFLPVVIDESKKKNKPKGPLLNNPMKDENNYKPLSFPISFDSPYKDNSSSTTNTPGAGGYGGQTGINTGIGAYDVGCVPGGK